MPSSTSHSLGFARSCGKLAWKNPGTVLQTLGYYEVVFGPNSGDGLDFFGVITEVEVGDLPVALECSAQALCSRGIMINS